MASCSFEPAQRDYFDGWLPREEIRLSSNNDTATSYTERGQVIKQLAIGLGGLILVLIVVLVVIFSIAIQVEMRPP
jgi:hypothetical protein